MEIIRLSESILAASSGNTTAAYANACSRRNDAAWWEYTTGHAPAHEMRERVIDHLHRRLLNPTGFERFPR
jgi:hypothetical protein